MKKAKLAIAVLGLMSFLPLASTAATHPFTDTGYVDFLMAKKTGDFRVKLTNHSRVYVAAHNTDATPLWYSLLMAAQTTSTRVIAYVDSTQTDSIKVDSLRLN